MAELLKSWEHNPVNGTEKKIVSSNLKHKKLSPLASKQTSEKKNAQSKNKPSKVNVKSNLYLPKQKSERSVDIEGQKSVPFQKKISRLCRSDIKQKNGKVDENKANSGGKTKEINTEKDYELYKNLLHLDSVQDSDSLESDFDEERGFTTADRFLMLNQLNKELERREHVIKDIKKQKTDELLKTQKSESEIDDEFAAYDDEINKIIKEYFKDAQDKDSTPNITKETESPKKGTKSLEKEQSLESDDSENGENLKVEVQKMMESLNKRVDDYNLRKSDFEQYFDPLEGVTDQKLHNYFLTEVMTDKVKQSPNPAIQDKHSEVDTAISEVDKTVDVLYPLSTEEKRQNLLKLLNDLKSEPFLQEKSLRNVRKISKNIPFRTTQSDRSSKALSAKETLANQAMVPLLDKTDKFMERGKEHDQEFRIMFSDVSTSEEEEEEGKKKDVQAEREEEKETRTSLRKTFGIVMKHMKDKSDPDKKSGMQRLLTRHKRKQEEEAHRRRDFARWFGESSIKGYKQRERVEVPGWKPGWHRLDSHLKDGILKNGRDGKLRLKKGHDSDPIDEYRRLLKEYEQIEGKVKLAEDKVDKKSGDIDINQGEKWIKIRKGTLMKDYQIRWRQGMYYLVERKHIKKKTKQTLSKKRMIRANTDKAKDSSKHVNKKTGKLNITRYLGKKKGSQTVEDNRKSFRKRGDAAKEIRRILSRLESKHLDQDDKDWMDKDKYKLKWTRSKLTNHFKRKCQELGLEVSDTEVHDSRETFRKYCLKYFQTKLQKIENNLKKQHKDMYPLGLFIPKKISAGDLGELEDELSDYSEKACSDEEEIFNEALTKEIFSFWITDLQTSKRYEEEIQILGANRGKPNIESAKKIFGDNPRFLTEHPKKPSRAHSTVKSDAEQVAQHCSDHFVLPPDIRDRFFGTRPAVSDSPIRIPFGDKYLTKDKSYLVALSSQSDSKIYSDVLSEMKQEGLIETINYQHLKDDEAIFPWDEIKIELTEYPAYKEYSFKKEKQTSLLKDEHASEEEDSWPELDDVIPPRSNLANFD